ncbi:MAG: hypothetical protein ACREFR_04410, partial [Limisphaerales bacterium]
MQNRIRLGGFIPLITVLFWSAAMLAQETSGIHKSQGDVSAVEKQNSSEATDIIRVLRENGARLGCCFTLEYRSYDITGKASLIERPVRTNLNAVSIPLLISKLRGFLAGFIIVQDIK